VPHDTNTQFENAVRTMMLHVGENPEREGLVDTPERVRKSYEFIYGGYKEDPKAILQKALFSTSNDEMVLVKDILEYSIVKQGFPKLLKSLQKTRLEYQSLLILF